MESRSVRSIKGEVRWYHVARSRAIRRILERGLARWLALHQQFIAGQPRYRAIFQREGDGHQVHCQIEVLAGGETWVGSRMGSGIQQALQECLAHMSRVTGGVPAGASA